jgi:hypothetical protein
MSCIHNQPLCYGKNNFSQDDLRHTQKRCQRCKQMLYPEDVFDCIPLIDCITIIRVQKDSTFKFSI